jgi:hypothetical protein
MNIQRKYKDVKLCLHRNGNQIVMLGRTSSGKSRSIVGLPTKPGKMMTYSIHWEVEWGSEDSSDSSSYQSSDNQVGTRTHQRDNRDNCSNGLWDSRVLVTSTATEQGNYAHTYAHTHKLVPQIQRQGWSGTRSIQEQSLSWEADSRSASQRIPLHLLNPKAHWDP